MKPIEPFIESEEQRLETSVRELRKRNFSNNLPFLILSDKLPDGQAYHEFADGRIGLQGVVDSETSYTFKLIRVLSSTEADRVRSEYGFY